MLDIEDESTGKPLGSISYLFLDSNSLINMPEILRPGFMFRDILWFTKLALLFGTL